ncbi:HEAVY METAL ASSOCIATED PROTEIN 52 [Hibiscus trionum]|uniref:HEAVY METAL ASSOCIATED PROTEIN 52 n=1 Tax=Hibiscus trionum TaxID=183268 RepID=A0A9W7H793_HIBTR|nr:HEAVY METAL ASSOCIATED PROTEIN 52 [Hibiscus trionum]
MGEDKKEEEENPEIVLKVDMHCEACARKVARTLKGFQGVEAVATDSKANKVVVKGKTANPTEVYERLLKKYGRKVELVSPLPKPPPPPPPAEEEKKDENKESKPKEEPPPAVITVVLKVGMHCEACAQLLRKRIRKIKGVESVETDVGNDQVVVKGTVDPAKLVAYVYKRTGKQATVVKGEEKKEEEKKEEETKKESEEGAKGGEKDDKQSEDMKRSEYLPSKYYSEFEYPPQFFSDENPNACSLM